MSRAQALDLAIAFLEARDAAAIRGGTLLAGEELVEVTGAEAEQEWPGGRWP